MAPQTHHAPAPLVAPDVDLRDFPYVPLYRHRLLVSRFHHLASDAEWRAGVTLWLASWDQHPAGSLPNDDRELCQLAGLGRDLRQWRKVKKWALYNWKLCDDTRFYHHVVAEGVNEAWRVKQANRHRTEAARAARNNNRDSTVTDNVTSAPSPDPSPGKVKGEGEGEAPPTGGARARSGARRARANGHAKSPGLKLYEGAYRATQQPSGEEQQPGNRGDSRASAKPLLGPGSTK